MGWRDAWGQEEVQAMRMLHNSKDGVPTQGRSLRRENFRFIAKQLERGKWCLVSLNPSRSCGTIRLLQGLLTSRCLTKPGPMGILQLDQETQSRKRKKPGLDVRGRRNSLELQAGRVSRFDRLAPEASPFVQERRPLDSTANGIPTCQSPEESAIGLDATNLDNSRKRRKRDCHVHQQQAPHSTAHSNDGMQQPYHEEAMAGTPIMEGNARVDQPWPIANAFVPSARSDLTLPPFVLTPHGHEERLSSFSPPPRAAQF